VTLSAYVVPVTFNDDDTEDSGLWMSYRRLGATFGEYDDFPPCDEEPVPEYWNRGRVWLSANANAEEGGPTDEWMEKKFGRGSREPSQAQGQNGGGPGPKSLVCEFRVWNERPFQKDNGHLEKEEAHANDSEIIKRWDQVTGEWMSRRQILACRRERWDFRTVPSHSEIAALSVSKA